MFGYIESNCIATLGNMSPNIRKLNTKKLQQQQQKIWEKLFYLSGNCWFLREGEGAREPCRSTVGDMDRMPGQLIGQVYFDNVCSQAGMALIVERF